MGYSISAVTSGRQVIKDNSASFGIYDWELDAEWEKIGKTDNPIAQESAIKNTTAFVLRRLSINIAASDLPEPATNISLVNLIEGRPCPHSRPTEKAALIRAAFKTKLNSTITDRLRDPEQFKKLFLTKLMAA